MGRCFRFSKTSLLTNSTHCSGTLAAAFVTLRSSVVRMPYLCLTLLVIAAGLASAHDLITTKLTWSAEISRIVLKRCAGCHKEGGTAPMPLTAYEGVRPWAKAIRDEVLSRRIRRGAP